METSLVNGINGYTKSRASPVNGRHDPQLADTRPNGIGKMPRRRTGLDRHRCFVVAAREEGGEPFRRPRKPVLPHSLAPTRDRARVEKGLMQIDADVMFEHGLSSSQPVHAMVETHMLPDESMRRPFHLITEAGLCCTE